MKELFSIECRQTKTTVIPMANQKQGKELLRTHRQANQSAGKRTYSKRGKKQVTIAREDASNQVAIGFSFASDWLRKWQEFSEPITKRNKAKPKQPGIIFNTKLKIVVGDNNKVKENRFHYCILDTSM